ncbi:MAG TPA: hypothetical protein VHY91_03320 [Pirellulales bacterium]|jgi:hypothetical protein|nr:hypothetical protein [Pirellulales bacterium]
MSRRPINPFYPLLIAVSVIFVITACAYGVMALRAISSATAGTGHPLLAFLDRHGMLLLMVEVAALAAAALLAMSTDRFWTERDVRHRRK